MQTMKKKIKEIISFIEGNRPLNLANLGSYSEIRRPRKIFGKKGIFIGNNTQILNNAKLEAYSIIRGMRLNGKIIIGNNDYIASSVIIYAAKIVQIGNDCVISDRVSIIDSSHGLDPTAGHIMEQDLTNLKGIVIGDNTFIGINSVILPGVELGHNCVVGASSVVTKSFPAFSMIAGNPAKLIKSYNQETKNWE